MKQGKRERYPQTQNAEVDCSHSPTEGGSAGDDAGRGEEQIVPRHAPRVNARRGTLKRMPDPTAAQRNDARTDVLGLNARVEGVAPVATGAKASAAVGRRGPPQASVNDPVRLLPVEEEIAPLRRCDERNRKDRVPATQMRSHARVALRDENDRRSSFGEHQSEGLVAQHATRLGWDSRHVEVGLEKS